MYNKILVPLDGSKLAEQVLPYARLLADAYGAVMTLLMVADPNARPPFSMGQAAGDYLKHMAASLQPLSVQSVEKIGRPAEVIVDSAKEGADCLIAMATHGVTGLRRWFMGSVASKVAQSAANPLLLIRPVEEGLPPGDPHAQAGCSSAGRLGLGRESSAPCRGRGKKTETRSVAGQSL